MCDDWNAIGRDLEDLHTLAKAIPPYGDEEGYKRVCSQFEEFKSLWAHLSAQIGERMVKLDNGEEIMESVWLKPILTSTSQVDTEHENHSGTLTLKKNKFLNHWEVRNRLNYLLHSIEDSLPKERRASILENRDPNMERRILLKFQRLIFQTVDYMLSHDWMDQKCFEDFVSMGNTIKLAAVNMVLNFELRYSENLNQPLAMKFYNYPETELILTDQHSSHCLNFFNSKLNSTVKMG
jgi:hypothetical protein